MKFYGNGVVWNPIKKKALCRFNKHGEFETDDKDIIKKLVELEYKHDGKVEIEEEIVEDEVILDDLTNNDIRKLLDDKGIKGVARKNRKQLLKLLEGE